MADPIDDLQPLLEINPPIDGEDSDDTDSSETSSGTKCFSTLIHC